MAWQRVASVAVTVSEKQLAVYRIGDNFHALDDVCPQDRKSVV